MIDLVIIGAGPIGLACGLEAKKKGLSFKIIDKGCITNSIYNYPLNMTFFSTSDKLEIGDVPFVSIQSKPNRSEALEYYRRVAQLMKSDLRLFEQVKGIHKTEFGFEIQTAKEKIISKYIIIATGFYDKPVMLDIKGEHLEKVRHYFFDAHYYAFQKVLVIGSNNSAVDAALECYRKGAEVTMVIRELSFTDRVKYWAKPDIENRCKEGSIKAYFNSELSEIREHEVIIQTPEGSKILENDFVLSMTGYQPDTSFLQNAGISLKNKYPNEPYYNPMTMESSAKNIFLAGVICGGMHTHIWFIENSRVHAEMIMNEINVREKNLIYSINK